MATAWTVPIRRSSPMVSDQSDKPAAAVGTALRMPRPIRRWDATALRFPPTRSSMNELVQKPMGRSVSTGCSGWPVQVPLRASLTGPCPMRPATLEATGLPTLSMASVVASL